MSSPSTALSAASAPAASTSGSLSQLTAPEVLQNILSRGLTGRLRVQVGPHRKQVFFERGQPVFATSSDPAESMGEVLIRRGRISRDQLRQALAKTASAKKVGRALIELGALEPQELFGALESQVAEVILSLFVLAEGSFVFEEGPLPEDEVIRLKLKTEALLKEGARRMTDPRLLLRALGSLESQLEPAEPALRLAFEPREQGLLSALRESRKSVRELCRGSKLPAMTTCQALIALVAAGAARRI